MKISYNWLQEHIEQKLPAPKDLAQKVIFHAFEVESIEEKNGDTVMEVKVLPDRAGDCSSHKGMAREVVGLLNLSLKQKELAPLPEGVPVFSLELQSDLCKRYIAVRIDGVKVGPSPDWLKSKLEAIGQRSINNVVDATNFVLQDSGQPVHAFDAQKVDGGIVVRLAREGEPIKLLGAKEGDSETLLKEGDLVIADFLGTLAIAGVKGGTNAEVTDTTTSIVIEVANFDATAVRKTSRRLGLITDASKRFENNLSSEFVYLAAQQVVALILELAGGTISAMTEKNNAPYTERRLSFKAHDITRLLGGGMTATFVADVFGRYGYKYAQDGDTFTLTVPYWRNDITGAHDVAEEVGRVTGYDTIPALPLPFTPVAEPNATDMQMSAVRAWCAENGYREVATYSFRPKGEVQVEYGAKGKQFLRANLSDGLKESFELNLVNTPLLGMSEVKLFEIGTVFFADREEIHVATCDKGTIQELLITDFIKENGIDPAVSQPPTNYSLLSTHSFVPWSSFPFITRDIAVWVSNDAAKSALAEAAATFAAAHCIRPPELFDEFSKDGRTSVAYRFVFQAPDRTLTDAEITTQFETLLSAVRIIPDAEIR